MRIAILLFSPLAPDARVLRQVEALRQRHDVMIVAEQPALPELWGAQYGPLPPAGWIARKFNALRRRAGVLVSMKFRDFLGRFTPHYRMTRRYLQQYKPDLILSNELHPLAVAREYHRATGCPVLLDFHEFYAGDTKSGPDVEKYDRPNIAWALHDAAKWAAGAITVNEMIARRYHDDYGFDCSVVYNAPMQKTPPVFRPVNPERIELVHVGIFHDDRRPEVMAEGVTMAGDPWRLHFYFAGDQQKISAFREHWHRKSAGRVIVHETLPVAEIESTIASCDLGISMIPTVSWNWLMSSPNKYFSFLAAGLGMILGPKPWKQMMNDRWGVAEMTPGFEAEDLAKTLRSMTPDGVNKLKQRAVEASAHLNGNRESDKLLSNCERFAKSIRQPTSN